MEEIKKSFSLEYYIKQNTYKKMPYTIPEIYEYLETFGKLPFSCRDKENWVYEYLIERQRKSGVYNDQFFTPPRLAEKFADEIDSHVAIFKTDIIIDLCCGFGGLSKEFKKKGFNNITGVDCDKEQDFDYACEKLGINYLDSDIESLNVEVFEKADLIISNPPYQTNFYPSFFNKSFDLLESFGTLALILPTPFFDTLRDKETKKALEKWTLPYKICDSNIDFVRTKVSTSIFILNIND